MNSRKYKRVLKMTSAVFAALVLAAPTAWGQGLRVGQAQGLRLGQDQGLRLGQAHGLRPEQRGAEARPAASTPAPDSKEPSASHQSNRTAITLSPHLTELVYAAGAGDHLLGVAEGSNYPPTAAALPKVGSGVTPNIERIAVLHPSVILAWGFRNGANQSDPALQKLNIPIRYQAPQTLDDVVRDIGELGSLFGTQQTAGDTVRQLQAILSSTRARYEHAAPVSVFVLVSREPLYTLGNNSFVMDALHACGAESAFTSLTAPAPIVSREQLLIARPQMVLFAAKAKDAEQQAITRTLASVGLRLKPDQIIGQDPDILFRPTDRLIRSLPALCEQIDQVRHQLPQAASESP